MAWNAIPSNGIAIALGWQELALSFDEVVTQDQ